MAAEIDTSFRRQLDFGMETTYSGRPGRDMVERAKAADYRIEGVYIGTERPEINSARIRQRAEDLTGHWVNPDCIPTRWAYSLSNLRRTAELFDDLELFDNSRHDVLYRTRLVSQCVIQRGELVRRADEPVRWAVEWLEKHRARQASLRNLAVKRERVRLEQERAARRRARVQRPGSGR